MHISIRVALAPVLMCLGTVNLAMAQDTTTPPAPTQGGDEAATAEATHAAHQTMERYAAAFNSGDAAGMAACWTEKGVFTSRTTGEMIAGRPALAEEFTALLAENEGRKIELIMGDVQLISPSVVTQPGTIVVSDGEEQIGESDFSVVMVDIDGVWLIDRVTEVEVDTPPSHYEQLKVLEWMIGDWTQEDAESSITTSCQWTKNNNYLIRTFSVETESDDTHTGMQLIGWDPAESRIRSWSFDSDGGFAEASWEQKGDSWIVTTKATLPDGGKGSATSIFREVGEDRFTWQRVNRIIDGEILPNVDPVSIIRQR